MPSNNFKVGEMLNKRTPNTKTWMNFDGSYTTEIHSGIVHFDDGLNNLHNINTSLFDEADADTYEGPTSRHGKNMLKHEKEKVKDKKKKGKMNRDDFDYQVPTLPFSCQIPKNIKKGYSIGQNDEFVRFIPQNVSPSKGYVNKTKTNEIQYQDAWNDTDIILEVTDRGIKETMLLKTDRAPFKFSFEVDGAIEDDLTMGNLKLEPAWLIDAVGEKRDVSQVIRREGEITYIDLVADVEGLVYPIEIDPTVTIQGDGTAGKDTYIRDFSPTETRGADSALWFGAVSSTNKFRALLQFDLSNIVGSVTDASLQLSLQGGGSSNANPVIKRVTQSWDELTVNWNNQPTFDSAIQGEFGPSSKNVGAIDFSITNLVKSWVDGVNTNYGMVIIEKAENISESYLYAYSSDSTTVASRPKLTITYNTPPTAPTVTTPNGGETWNSSHTVEWLGGSDIFDILKLENGVATTTFGTNYTYKKGMQSFLNVNETKLNRIEINLTNFQGTDFDVILANSSYVPIETKQVRGRTSLEEWVVVDGFSAMLSANTTYIIILDPSSQNKNMAIRMNSNNPYANGNYAGFNGSGWVGFSSDDMNIRIFGSDYNLMHQIQLSTDNGTNWSDIIALTSAGVTQYIHDFINAPQTSTAKIRIRAFDGTSYGPWDESDGVFSIIHNLAPSAPTNLTPVTTKDRAELIRFAWQHNDPNADAQSKFDLQYRLQGATTWNTVTQNTINQFYDLPAATLPRGTIEWRVRTYDQADLSGPYSELKTFIAGDKPSKPTTLNPTDGSIVSVSNPTVEWSSVGQVGYNLKVLDASETEVLWEINQTSNNKAHTVGYSLENETNYVIQLTIRNADGISSNVEKSHIHVSYTPPAIPMVETLADEERGSIIININNPEPTGTEPLEMFNEVYRRSLNEEWIRIADDVLSNTSFTDYSPASGKTYEYFVRSWGSNETFRDSAVFQSSVSFEHAQLALASDFSEWVELVYNKDTSRQKTRGRTLNQFAGRQYPLADFGDENTQSIALSYITQDYADVEHFYSITDRQETMLYRDREGRREFVTIDVTSEAEQYLGEIFNISFTVEKVWFKEGV